LQINAGKVPKWMGLGLWGILPFYLIRLVRDLDGAAERTAPPAGRITWLRACYNGHHVSTRLVG
jgi:hypothetical protein